MQRKATPTAATGRARPWLPDAQLDEHPIGSWLLEMGFDLWVRCCYNRAVILPDGFHVPPGTIIASNHQRDVDGPMLGVVLVHRRGLRFRWPLPFYATREDLFRTGILARLTVHWPRPLSALLGHVSLASFFPLGRAEPMRRVREFTLGEALDALCAAGCTGAGADAWLNARGRRELGTAAGLPLRELAAKAPLAARERWWGLRRLNRAARQRIAPGFRATVTAQLEHFARRLDRGRCVYFAPEGTISMDGRFGRVRGGFFRLARMAASPPWIQPMALSYDALAPGRPRTVVRIGEHFRADATLDRRAFDTTLRHAVVDLATVTPSHLLARWLVHGPATFTQAELAAWLARGIATLRNRGRPLDPLFGAHRAAGLANQRLRWLERRHLVERRGERFCNACPSGAPPGWERPANIVRYLDNQLSDLLPDADRDLPC